MFILVHETNLPLSFSPFIFFRPSAIGRMKLLVEKYGDGYEGYKVPNPFKQEEPSSSYAMEAVKVA